MARKTMLLESTKTKEEKAAKAKTHRRTGPHISFDVIEKQANNRLASRKIRKRSTGAKIEISWWKKEG